MTVETSENRRNILPMGKYAVSRMTRVSSTGRFVAGVTADGVAIRKSPGPATHFTSRAVEKAVAAVIAAGDKGRNAAKRTQHKKG